MVSPPLNLYSENDHGIPTTEPIFREWQSTICRSLKPPKILGQKWQMQPLRWLKRATKNSILQVEPRIKVMSKNHLFCQSIAQITHSYYKFRSLWLSRYIWICTQTQNFQNVSSRIRRLKWYLPQWPHCRHHSTLGHWSFPAASCNLSLVSWRWCPPL